jgi:hypothetical protein
MVRDMVCCTLEIADPATAHLSRQQWPRRQVLHPEGSAKGGAGRALRDNHSAHAMSANRLLLLKSSFISRLVVELRQKYQDKDIS